MEIVADNPLFTHVPDLEALDARLGDVAMRIITTEERRIT